MRSLFASFSSCLSTLPPRSCPTPQLAQKMQQGIALMRVPAQWDQALQLFDRMVTLAPTFAEVGWGLGAVNNFELCDCIHLCSVLPRRHRASSPAASEGGQELCPSLCTLLRALDTVRAVPLALPSFPCRPTTSGPQCSSCCSDLRKPSPTAGSRCR